LPRSAGVRVGGSYGRASHRAALSVGDCARECGRVLLRAGDGCDARHCAKQRKRKPDKRCSLFQGFSLPVTVSLLIAVGEREFWRRAMKRTTSLQ
jgi:hypothetical protein